MDFGSLLSVAQKNAKTTKKSTERSKFYSTKFEPPKKESKDRKLSDGIRKFLAQKEHEERKEKEKKRKEYEELMALRTDSEKNKIKKHLKVTKSANKSVLEDAVNKTDTAVTMEGPEQPDEDDYGYTSNEASALYKRIMDKYKSIPEDTKFSKSNITGSRNADLLSTKDRVRAAILREREEEKLGRKRSHSTVTSSDSQSQSSSLNDQKNRLRKNLYDPKAEREAEERQKEEDKRQKVRNKRPPPPLMDFQSILKLAAEKQHQDVVVEVPQKSKEPERLLTSKEKKELELRKAQQEERERRRNGIPSKPQANGDSRKPESSLANGRIPKLNSSTNQLSSKPTSSSSSSSSQSAVDSRKASTSVFKEPIRPAPSISSSKMPSKSQPISNLSKQMPSKSSNVPQSNGKRPIDMKPKSQTYDNAQRNPTKNSSISRQPKSIDSKNVKPRELPSKNTVKPREFPPRDLIKPREFPPRDLVKSREFPPRDVQRRHSSMKHKQTAASKRRILDDSDEDEDEYDSEMDDFIDDDEPELDYSSEIKRMFGYDKSRYRDEDDDIDDMESSFAQQQREEFISKKIGIMEDLEDMRMEEEEKKRKASKRQRF